jgi:pyruvate, water dikinase
MEKNKNSIRSGLPGLDRMLLGLMPGDNVVWEVDSIEDYVPFMQPFLDQARRQGIRLIYFRFARHAALIDEDAGIQIVRLDPQLGFERFLSEILATIEQAGPGAYYVFDCLSDLAADWYSDRMLGNFFMIACPFLYQLDTIAYFALLKNFHSFHATDGIFNTAQVILEVYRHKHQMYLLPVKVHERSSPTMYMLHHWASEEFAPVTSSAVISEILAGDPKPWLDFTIHRRGTWAQTFLQAQELLQAVRSGVKSVEEAKPYFERLLKMALTRDERFLSLARKYFDLADLIEILKRMIGTGLIGGKSLGMLLARAILRKTDPYWTERLEVHDSFFIGSDVFYTYLVKNGCWWLRRKEQEFDLLLAHAEEAREKLLTGEFPEYIKHQFTEMLEYFGQSPIIVRSSSLLEDNYGNAFSGKYESIYCANQGTPQDRLAAFMAAVRRVYASTVSKEALTYRLLHGLLDKDEQMGLLIQRVSGTMYDGLFFPLAAGVGFSFNPYVWNEEIDPHTGMIRLVMGLGTRAVERNDDDYARVVALNVPERKPESNIDELRQYAQRYVDVLDLGLNQLLARKFEEVAAVVPKTTLNLVASRDPDLAEQLKDTPNREFLPWVLTFEKLFSETDFIQDMRRMLKTIHEAYNYPVDVEFTANFLEDGRYRINLVQCRPFQAIIKREGSRINFPRKLEPEKTVLTTRGPVIGQSQATIVDRVVYVVPSVYGMMSQSHRYSVARTIGRLLHVETKENRKTILLIGPGRWGTSMPSLGVPVSFAEINTVSALCEIVQMREGIVPDVSLGTHFFNDLVEMDMLYLAVFPEKEGYGWNGDFFIRTPNRLTELLPEAAPWSEVIKVIDSAGIAPDAQIFLNADAMKQKAVCYWEHRK